jgi:hypothetical protein
MGNPVLKDFMQSQQRSKYSFFLKKKTLVLFVAN